MYALRMAHEPTRHERDEKMRREALDALERVKHESETIGTSALARTARRAADHFSAKDAAKNDAIEVWGSRIGRGLSLVGVIALAIYLYLTYVR